jgi:hypothetical protein
MNLGLYMKAGGSTSQTALVDACYFRFGRNR